MNWPIGPEGGPSFPLLVKDREEEKWPLFHSSESEEDQSELVGLDLAQRVEEEEDEKFFQEALSKEEKYNCF